MSIFAATEFGRAKYQRQRLAHAVLLMMTAVLVLPLIGIIGLLLVRGAPAMSIEFLTEEPISGMTAGGIFPAIVGTLCDRRR